MPKQIFKVGDKIVVCHDLSDLATIREHVIIKVMDSAQTVSTKYGTFHQSDCWPAKYRTELEEIVRKRQELKKELDDSMSLIYKLRNKIHSLG